MEHLYQRTPRIPLAYPSHTLLIPLAFCSSRAGNVVQASEVLRALFACPTTAQRPLYCCGPKQTTTLAGIIKPSSIFTPGTLLSALAHEYIFIFVRNKNVFIASLFVAVGRRLRYALSEYEMRLLIRCMYRVCQKEGT
jgi:hypothetical protein